MSAHGSPGDRRRIKFLIAHSDHFTQRAIEITLRDLHATTLHARDGLDAIDQALDQTPDAVVLGTQLPGLSGLDVARTFRALTPTHELPILFITADDQDTRLVRQAALPGVTWLQQPLDLAHVRDDLERLVARQTPPDPGAPNQSGELAGITDVQTGLYGRQYMFHRLAYEAARATRYGTTLAVLLVGIQNSSALHDRWGIGGLDRFAVNLANLMRRNLRVVDLLGRTEPGQFLIIAPHTDAAGAQVVAHRIRAALAAESGPPGIPPGIELCIGIAVSSRVNLIENLALFARAQSALDRALSGATPIVVG